MKYCLKYLCQFRHDETVDKVKEKNIHDSSQDTKNKSIVQCNECNNDSECVPCIMKHIRANYDREDKCDSTREKNKLKVCQLINVMIVMMNLNVCHA